MYEWKAQVRLSTGTQNNSFNLQWVFERARNAYEAKLAIQAKYGRLIQGPIKVNGNGTGRFIDNW